MTRERPLPSVALGVSAILFVLLALIVFPSISSAASDVPGDPVRGKADFEKRCTGCHSLDHAKEGPPLGNVYGRRAGSAPNFNYSDALKSAHFTWDETLLDKWLTNTESVVPDNDMDFHVPNPQERADIIRYLKVSSGK